MTGTPKTSTTFILIALQLHSMSCFRSLEHHSRLVRLIQIQMHRGVLKLSFPNIITEGGSRAKRFAQRLVQVRIPLWRSGTGVEVVGTRQVAGVAIIPVASVPIFQTTDYYIKAHTIYSTYNTHSEHEKARASKREKQRMREREDLGYIQ